MDSTPFLHPESGQPLYMQLYAHYRHEILTGRLPANARLTSVRHLSLSLGISKITVETAYQQLVAEGFVESRARSGFYVAQLDEYVPEKLLLTERNETVPQKRKPLQPLVTTQQVLYDFHGSVIDLEHFPFNHWRKCMNEALEHYQNDFAFYGDDQGEPELLVQIARYLHLARTVRCRPQQILLGSGLQQAVAMIALMLGPEPTKIAIEEPGYADVREVFRQHGHQLVPIPLEEDGIRLDKLWQSEAKAVYITPAHQYPHGMIMPIGKRLKLLQWASQTGAYIIENDYDGEFRYNVKPTPSLQGLDQTGRVIYVGNFSKALSPALRVNYTVLPPELLERYRRDFAMYPSPVPRHLQRTLQLFMQKGYWDRHVRRMRSLYSQKHAALLEAVAALLPHNQVTVLAQSAGLHIVLEIQTTRTAEELAQAARAVGVKVYTVTRSWMDGDHSQSPRMLLGFGGLRPEQIRQGVRLLGQAWFGK